MSAHRKRQVEYPKIKVNLSRHPFPTGSTVVESLGSYPAQYINLMFHVIVDDLIVFKHLAPLPKLYGSQEDDEAPRKMGGQRQSS